MDRETTSVLRGLAILGIVFHHCSQYFDYLGILESPVRHSGYALTAIFFLFSGYGCYFSFKKYNSIEDRKQLIKPISLWTIQHSLRIYFDFILILILNIVLSLFLNFGYSLSLKEIVYDMFTITQPTWTSWYPKIQILCYIVLALSFIISKKHKEIISFLTLLIYVVLVWKLDFASMWYTSVMCFPVGMLFAHCLPNIKISKAKYIVVFFVSTIVFAGLFYAQTIFLQSLLRFVSAIVLSFVIVSFTGIFKLKSRVLSFIGNISFEVYLVHLMLIRLFVILNLNVYLSVLLILFVSIVLGYLTNCIVIKFNKLLFRKKG